MPLPLNEIICGDAFQLIEQLPDASINLVITSPPYYHQRDYGAGIGNEERVEEYVEKLVNLTRQCLRVLRSDGSIVFNLGDKYEDANLMLVPYRFAIEATKLSPIRLVNQITWVKLNPTPRQFKRRLVSSTEPFFHFVKSNDYYYNPDAFMANDRSKSTGKSPTANLGRKYVELIEKSELTPEQKLHARESLRQVIKEVQEGKIEGFRMKIRGIHSEPFGGQAGGRQMHLQRYGFTIIRLSGIPMKRDVIQMPVESIKGRNHPAIYPVALIAEFLNLLTRKGDVVLDPFMGSGSTAVACQSNERQYIGYELNPAYCQFAKERLQNLPNTPIRLF